MNFYRLFNMRRRTPSVFIFLLGVGLMALLSKPAYSMQDDIDRQDENAPVIEKTLEDKLRDALYEIWDQHPKDAPRYLEDIAQIIKDGANLNAPIPQTDERYDGEGYSLLFKFLISPFVEPSNCYYWEKMNQKHALALGGNLLHLFLSSKSFHNNATEVSTQDYALHKNLTLMQAPFYYSYNDHTLSKKMASTFLKELIKRGAKADQKNANGEATVHFLFGDANDSVLSVLEEIKAGTMPEDSDVTSFAQYLKMKLDMLESAFPDEESFLQQVCNSDLEKPLMHAPWNGHSLITLPAHPSIRQLADNLIERCRAWKNKMALRALAFRGPRTKGHNLITKKPHSITSPFSEDVIVNIADFEGSRNVADDALKKYPSKREFARKKGEQVPNQPRYQRCGTHLMHQKFIKNPK